MIKYREYLASKAVTICTAAIVLIICLILQIVTGEPVYLILLTAGSMTAVVFMWSLTDFLIKKSRLKKLHAKLEKLPEKYLAGEIIERPADIIEQEYFEIMKEVSRSAIGAVEQSRHEKQEYCDYVESWVHEIKTPLTACSLILTNDADTDKIKREIKRADNQTENILYYARLRTSEKDMQISPVKVEEIVSNALHNEMELLIAAHIGVEVEGEFVVNTDPKQLEFIIKQLLINCAKYCQGCTVRITAFNMVLSVEDNGPGIPKHELPRITERGFTGAGWRTGRGSTGMGLYIVNEMCKKLNIHLAIFSTEGEYTRFEMHFQTR